MTEIMCVRRITNDTNKFLVNREYIYFFMKIYMQWISDNSIRFLPHFEKLNLSQFKVYIEVEKMTHCYVCNNCKMSIFIQSYNVKEGFFNFTDVKYPYKFVRVE